MDEDFIAGLTRQVREDVIENYLTERRLIEVQIEDISNRAKEVRKLAARTGRRLSRLAYLMIQPDMRTMLAQVILVPQDSFWYSFIDRKFTPDIQFIRVRGLTDKAKFRRLLLEAYSRLHRRMSGYGKAYEELRLDCEAVNANIVTFHKNFDLLTILSFIRSLDILTVERQRFLGDNFTPDEIASVDEKLYIRRIVFEKLDVPAPLSLPTPEYIEHTLVDLAGEVYRKYEKRVKTLLQ